MPLPAITLKKLHHRGKDRIGLYFTYNRTLIAHTKKLKGATWSATNKCWYVDKERDSLQKIFAHYKGVARIDVNNLTEAQTRKKESGGKIKEAAIAGGYKARLSAKAKKQIETVAQKLATEGFSQSSIRTYQNMLEIFLGFIKKDAGEITIEDVRDFQFNFWVKHHYSSATQRQFIAALKHLMSFTPQNKLEIEALVLPKKEKKLPKVLSEQEIIRILNNVRNLKHFIALGLLYSAGLRISELINLRIEDIDFNREQIHIRRAKGRKDRYVGLSKQLLPLLEKYLVFYDPDTYLLNGQTQLQYSTSSIRKLLKQAADRAGISKRVHPHMLRHSYATHMLENGIDIRHIQELLGHHKPETTMIYTHVTTKQLTAIKSPLDTIVEHISRDNEHMEPEKFLLSGK